MKVTLYTDGAARGNPDGPGGYGTILQYVDGKGTLHERTYSQGYEKTTNNRMELMAVIEALRALKRPCKVVLHTDSQYVQKGISEWIHKWKARGWRTADKKLVKNVDLWMELDQARAQHDIDWRWIKGHAGHEGNEKADQLANKGVDSVL